MVNKLKSLFYKFFDYEIISSYYDIERDEQGRFYYKQKHNRKYYLKCLNKRRGGQK